MHYPGISLEGMKENHTNFSVDPQSSAKILPGPSPNESKVFYLNHKIRYERELVLAGMGD
jgi:hypothetical protein